MGLRFVLMTALGWFSAVTNAAAINIDASFRPDTASATGR
ncbi:hypothetical protein C8K63_10498 [Pseudomonas sp. GV085]|nr:hypothetical protein C8K63_10498 [Pseudomonas sp. GV085]